MAPIDLFHAGLPQKFYLWKNKTEWNNPAVSAKRDKAKHVKQGMSVALPAPFCPSTPVDCPVAAPLSYHFALDPGPGALPSG